MATIPAHIEKSLAKLKAQIEKAKIEGAYIVYSQEIIYTAEEQSQILPIESLKWETDSQRLRRRMETFLQDLRQSKPLDQQPEVQ